MKIPDFVSERLEPHWAYRRAFLDDKLPDASLGERIFFEFVATYDAVVFGGRQKYKPSERILGDNVTVLYRH